MGNYRETLLLETREEIAKADAKASILLAASGIIVAALVAIGGANDWSPAHMHQQPARILGWVAIALIAVGILFVSAAVKPRLGASRPEGGKPYFFGDVEAYWPRWWQLRGREALEHRGRARLDAALASLTETDIEARLNDQIWRCSHIAYRKYRLLSVGMWLWAVALACGIAALLVEKQWP